jgi:hypothetical protein
MNDHHHTPQQTPATSNQPARVLVFSQRNIYRPEAWRCAFHELEGILQDIESVDVVAPTPSSWYRHGKALALRSGQIFRTPLNPGIPRLAVDREYDLFFAVCEKPSELLNVNVVNWKERCGTSVCWLPEFYLNEIPFYRSCLEVLSKFDHVVFMFAANEPFKRLLPGDYCYMPAGVDALTFCPEPEHPRRSIDVLSIGRRSDVTHKVLLRTAKAEGLFYVYDTLADLLTYDLGEHRSMVANLAKRSRYFIVNPGKINSPEETGGQSEFGYRYFEGAAAGSILIGDCPNNQEFPKIFNWPDAVIRVPFDSDSIDEVIRDLDTQPERQHRIRTQNTLECLQRHDWAYRWESILGMAGLQPLPGLSRRKERLRQVASKVEERQAAHQA